MKVEYGRWAMRIPVTMLAAVLGIGTVRADFLYESEMTVQGYAGTETLEGFPVLVRLAKGSPVGFDYTLCQTNGADIAFYAPDGSNFYPHEIDHWDTNGTSLVWVRIPSLSGTDTKFLFRFGDSTVTERPASKEVWDNSNDGFYAGVWHFGDEITAEDATATTAPASPDSAQHSASVDMSAKPASTAWNRDFRRMTSTNAVIGLGRVIDTVRINNGHYFACGDCSSFDMGNAFTISAWMKPCIKPSGDYCIMTFGNGLSSESGNWRFGWYGFNVDFGSLYSGSTQLWLPSITSYADVWRHLVLVFDGSTVKLYADGSVTATKTNLDAQLFADGLSFYLGGTDGISNYVGIFDEARLLKTAASADWVKAEYDAVKVADFIAAGAVKSRAANMLTITSDTEELGTVTPAYGVRTDIAGGDAVDFSAPDGVTVVSDVLKYRFDGWTLYRTNANDEYVEVDSAGTNSFHYVHESGTSVKFVWKVRRIVPISASATGGTVTVNGSSESTVWCEEGVATLLATPDDSHAFGYWTGSISDVAEITSRELVLTGAMARTVTPLFRKGRVAYIGEAPLTVSGCALGETVLTNFPVLVRISPERIRNFSYRDAGSDGSGIAFFSTDGKTAYAHEVDHWDVKGESLVWVKVPRLTGTETKMLFDYGAKCGDVTPAKYVWNDGCNIRYGAVWHMSEEIGAESAATTPSADSVEWSSLNLDAIADNDTQTSSNGVAGLSRRITDGITSRTGLSVPSFDALGLGGDYAVSAWFHYDFSVWYRDSFLTRNSFGIFKWYNYSCEYFTLDNDSGKMFSYANFSNAWHQLTFVCSNGTMSAYIDGEFKKTTSFDHLKSDGFPLLIGNCFHGRVDECRLGSVPESAAWMKAEYDTVANADFVTFGRARCYRGLTIFVR